MGSKANSAKGIVNSVRTRAAQKLDPNRADSTQPATASTPPATARPAAKKTADRTPQQGRRDDRSTGDNGRAAKKTAAPTAQQPMGEAVKRFTPSKLHAGDMLVVLTEYGTTYTYIGTDQTARSADFQIDDQHPAAAYVAVHSSSNDKPNGPARVTYVRDFVEPGRALMYVVDNAAPIKTSPVKKNGIRLIRKADRVNKA